MAGSGTCMHAWCTVRSAAPGRCSTGVQALNFMEGRMKKMHFAMSTLSAAPLSAAGASSFAQRRDNGGDHDHRDDGRYCQPDHDVVNNWREHHFRPPPRRVH